KDQLHPLIDTLFENPEEDTAFIAWTTTPWTLPSNTALVVGNKIDYVKIRTFNQYTGSPISIILAKNLISKHLKSEGQNIDLKDYKFGDKVIPWEVCAEFSGAELVGLRYHQLFPYITSEE